MSMSFEHDYPSEVPLMENKPDSGLNLKATELRLGLPGSESPERESSIDLNGTCKKSFVSSGTKRGFSVAINGDSGNWVFSASDGSESGFSPPSVNADKLINEPDSTQSPEPLVQQKKNHPASISKAQVVGWPPIRSFRKNTMACQPAKNDDNDTAEEAKQVGSGCLFIKVSMDGAPYLRKIDLKTYTSYMELSSGLEKMFSCFTIGQCDSHGDGLSENGLMDLLHGSEYVLTYQDKDDDWMLVGDVPWKMFTDTCRRLRITKSSDAIGLAPRAMEKCKSRN